jgi:hypothetical protein
VSIVVQNRRAVDFGSMEKGTRVTVIMVASEQILHEPKYSEQKNFAAALLLLQH